ncbi:hypothetical protein ACFL1S_07430 [Pseudomonadota bacterium]
MTDEYAWGNILSKQLGCRVSNYGVEGYGTDQALLRFRKNSNDKSNIVFLNHLSENILRNVNQSRGLLYPGSDPGFKPRFSMMEDGTLILIPLPDLSALEFDTYMSDPSSYLNHEYFLPNGPSGIVVGRFPYSYSIVKAFSNYHLRSKLRGQPRYLDFYSSSHASNALEITTEILVKFKQEATNLNKVPVISIIPTGDDLLYYSEKSIWPYHNLIKMLELKNVSVLNFGVGIIEYLDGKNPCSLFKDCSGHYNTSGYELLARIAYQYLKANGLIASIKNS